MNVWMVGFVVCNFGVVVFDVFDDFVDGGGVFVGFVGQEVGLIVILVLGRVGMNDIQQDKFVFV